MNIKNFSIQYRDALLAGGSVGEEEEWPLDIEIINSIQSSWNTMAEKSGFEKIIPELHIGCSTVELKRLCKKINSEAWNKLIFFLSASDFLRKDVSNSNPISFAWITKGKNLENILNGKIPNGLVHI